MQAAAFFDVDGTLTESRVIEPLVWYQQDRLPGWKYALWFFGLAAQAPYYLYLDRRSRGRFNEAFYRRYRGLKAADLADWHRRMFAQTLRRRVYPQAVECVRHMRQQCRAVVLVTGGLEWVMRPLAEFLEADHLIALRLKEHDGVCTGELDGPAIADEQKAVLVRQYAAQHDVDLARSEAYGNSIADAPMLECVGNPVAVNPDGRLRALAKARGWRVLEWKLH